MYLSGVSPKKREAPRRPSTLPPASGVRVKVRPIGDGRVAFASAFEDDASTPDELEDTDEKFSASALARLELRRGTL